MAQVAYAGRLGAFWDSLPQSRLPAEALLVGPAVMVAGVAMIERNKRESHRQPDSGCRDAVPHSNAR